MNGAVKDYFKKNAMTIILLLGAAAIYLCIPSQIAENVVTKTGISPRFFPTFATVGIMICSALLLIFDAKDRILAARRGEVVAGTEKKDEEISYLRVIAIIALMFVWYLLMPRIGFIISTIVVMCVMSYLLGCRNKILNIVFPIVFTLALYFAFVRLLHVSLPEILF